MGRRLYSYDAFSRLTSLAINNPSGQNQALGFGYNPAHQVVSRSASNDAYAYRGPNNIYAAASNPYTLNGLNQIAVSGSASFSYDGRGNLTGDASNSYGYDIANRMTSVSGAVGSPTLAYDPVGRLFQTLGSTRTWFVYDGSQILEEYSGPGAVTADYVYGPGGDEPLVWYDRVHGARYWLQANQQGSVVAVTADNGSVVALNSYDEYGLPGPGNLGRFQYTGQAWIPEIRMYDYKARVYSPNLGRFMQTDPVGYKDGLNWYGYVHGDPVNGSDPSGMTTLYHDGRINWSSGLTGINGQPFFPEYATADDAAQLEQTNDAIGGDGTSPKNLTKDSNGNFLYYHISGPFSDCDWCLHVSSPYAQGRGGGKLHAGIDFSTGGNSEVDALSVSPGVVVRIGAAGYGPHAVFVSNEAGLFFTYGHLSQNYVSVGDQVFAGTVIGRIGNSGDSTGIHLHLEITSGGIFTSGGARAIGISCSGSGILGC